MNAASLSHYLYQQVEEVVNQAVSALQAQGVLPEDLKVAAITVEPPRDASHGDMSTNAAMVLCKQAGLNPRELATKLTELLSANELISSCDIAGPGFINFKINTDGYRLELKNCLNSGLAYGQGTYGQGHKVNVEYVSANPTGPMHVGHTRGAVVGDALAALMEKAGYDVAREYYINDAGNQIDTLARSAHMRYREALGEDIGEIPEGLYPGEYLKDLGQKLADQFVGQYQNSPEDEWLPVFKPICIEAMMELIRSDLKLLNISHDVFSSEKALAESGKVEQAVDVLQGLDLIYEGTLPPPKGKENDEWEAVELTLFKAKQFGDDEDRALKKRDGTWTYTTPDIAYHWDKYKRGYDILITVVGADHIGWVKRIKAGTAAVTEGQADFTPILCALVNLLKDGQPFKLSKRAGNIITVRDVVEEVGSDVIRFIMLTRQANQTLDFDFSKVTEQSKDNPVFYVQYAHARCCSVLRHATEMFPDQDFSGQALADVDLSSLSVEDFGTIIKLIANWPRVIEQAARAREPHRIAFFLMEVAAAFHATWNMGNQNHDMRFLNAEDKEGSLARIALLKAVATVIASGLKVMGIDALEELRGENMDNAEEAA